MAQQTTSTPLHNSTVSRVRDVMSISCEGLAGTSLVVGASVDALCKALYRQIKATVPGYVYRTMPDLLEAPTRARDIRVRLIVKRQTENMTVQLEWYKGSENTPQKGPVVRLTSSEDATDAIARVLGETPGFTAGVRR